MITGRRFPALIPARKFLALFLPALLFPALTLLSCASDSRPTSVLLIVIDTLRADRLGSMGYAQARTPNLDALAARGARFTQAMTPVPVTLPAVASLLTGRLPMHHRVRDNESFVLGAGEETLAERCRDAGYRTTAVVGSAILAADRGLNQGFAVYDDTFGGAYPVYDSNLQFFAEEFAATRRRADTVTDLGLEALRGFGDEPFLLMAHYFDVHGYYDPPPAYAAQHPGRPYDGEISFTDAEIGRLLSAVGNRDDVLVVVVSDHGEGLGEHGEPEHGFLLYESTLHVPVIMAGPGVPPGTVRREPVSLVDLEPSLAAWIGLPAPSVPRDGRVIRWDEPLPETDLYAETMRTLVSYGWSELRAVRRGDWKLIRGPRSELYNLAADPGEVKDLGAQDPAGDLTRSLVALVGDETRAAVRASVEQDVDPERREVLESLGYVGAAGNAPAVDDDLPHPADQLGPWLDTQRSKVVLRQGLNLIREGKYAEGKELLDQVIAEGPPRAPVYFNRGLARLRLGDQAGYEEDLAEAMRLDPEYLPALGAYALDVETRDGAETALPYWRSIYDLDPSNAQALRALAKWHTDQGDAPGAIPYLRRLVVELPQNANARLNLALAALQSGYQDEAATHFRAFLEIAPDDPRGEQVRRILAQELGGG